MQFGYCVNMIAQTEYGIGFERIPKLKKIGFDYVELPLAQMMRLGEKAFRTKVLDTIDQYALPCFCCNNFFPPSYRLTGPEADHESALAYANAALSRAAALGAKKVVFGSGGARNMPLGFSCQKALEQLSSLLQSLGNMAAAYGITLVIEPLNISESNVINRFSQGLSLARQVNHPQVAALADSYHMRLSQEPWENLLDGGSRLQHMHIARPLHRSLPMALDGEKYNDFFANALQAGYNGTVSIEAYLLPGQEIEDIQVSLQYLRQQVG